MTENDGLTAIQVPAGPLATNAWVIVEQAGQTAFIVDAPPESLDAIGQALIEFNARPVMLILTHTHWDHIGDAEAIRTAYGIPLAVHALDRWRLDDPSDSPVPIAPAQVDRELVDGDVLELGNWQCTVLHTPGHSPGQISLYFGDNGILVGGDTLFPNGYGRTDIPGASEEQTVETIRRLLELPDEVKVLNGHGDATTIGRERPWMRHVAETGQLLG